MSDDTTPGRVSPLQAAALLGPHLVETFGADASDVAMATAVTLAVKEGRSQEAIIKTFSHLVAQIEGALRVLQ